MEKILRIFDFFKLAYDVNINNKKLYKPQIVLIIIKTCFYVLGGLFLYKFVLDIDRLGFTSELIWGSFWQIFLLALFALIVLGISGIIVESGLYNMYKSCILNGVTDKGDFEIGVKQFFWRFLLADILIILLWIVIVVPYVIVGVVTLLAGFVLVPVLIQIFTSMWKVSIVMEEIKVIEALKKSFSFAKNNFLPLSFLIIIQNSFESISKSSGSSGNSGSNINNLNPSSSNLGNDFASGVDASFYQWYSNALPYIKGGIIILIPVISIAVLISSLIKMIFQIFFSLSLFIMYHQFSNDELLNETKEVL